MRTEQLLYLLEISKNPSLHIASEKLNMTPQALSASIRKLEEELGFAVLERTTQGVTLTSDGRALLSAGKRFLSAVEKIQQKPAVHRQPALQGNMTLLATAGTADTILAPVLSHMYIDHPKLRLDVKLIKYHNIIETLLTQPNGLGIVYQIYRNNQPVAPLDEALIFEPFVKGRYYCAAHQRFAISRYKSASLRTLLDYPHVIYEPSASLTLAIFNAVGQPANIIYANTLALFQQMISSGVGLGFAMIIDNTLPPIVALPDTHLIAIKDNVTCRLGCLYRRDQPLDQRSRQFLDYLHDYYQQSSGSED